MFAISKMVLDGGQQGVDGLRLDFVGRFPLEPLKRRVFGQRRGHNRFNFTQEINDGLLKRLISGAFVGNGVTQLEMKGGVDQDRPARNAGFLLRFAKSGFQIGFAGFAVALGKIPSVNMPHQQKLTGLGARGQQDSGGAGDRQFVRVGHRY